MLNVSAEWEKAVINDNRRFLNRAQIISPHGNSDWQITVNSDRIMQGGAQFSSGTTSIGSFDIGATIIGKYTLLLQNYNDQFTDYLFEGATVIAYVGLGLSSGTEWIRKGTYIVSDAKIHNGIVTLTCYDNLHLFAKNIPDGFLNAPTTLDELLRHICSYCGVNLATNNLEMKNYMIRGVGEQATFLDAVGFIAQIEGAFARCNPLGQLEIVWYEEIVNGAGLDGGTFDFIEGNTSYHDGDIADGGSFNPWNLGFEFNAGDFIDMGRFWTIVSYTNNNIDIEDVVLTGIQIESTNGEEPYSVLAGEDGYIISITNNEFITETTASSVANHLKNKIVGMRFRPLKISILGNPAMEAGDNAYVVDRKGRAVHCLLTNIDYTIGSYASVSCDAMSAVRNSADRNSAMTKAIVQARKNTERMLSAYDLEMQQLTNLITQSFGLHKSEETLDDGSVIYYMHNKPLLKDSDTVWKMTADAFAVSTDGGKTWNAGIDSSGNVLVNVLSAIGINFDWARGGTLTLGGSNDAYGAMKILDANGGQIGKWDRNGIEATRADINGTLRNRDGEHGLTLINGRVYAYHNESLVGQMGSMGYANSNKRGFSMSSDADYLALSTGRTSGNALAIRYIINNGLNYEGYNERHVFEETVRISGSLFLGHDTTRIIGLGNSAAIVGGLIVDGAFSTTGAKNRVVGTSSGYVGMNAVESTGAFFQDYGSGIMDKNGECFIFLDPIFADTIEAKHEYYIQLTQTSDRNVGYAKKEDGYFVVYGEAGATFDWVISAKQKGYEMDRMEKIDIPDEQDFSDIPIINQGNIEEIANEYLEEYEKELGL